MHCLETLRQTQNSDELDSEGSDTEDHIREETLKNVRVTTRSQDAPLLGYDNQ